MKKSKRPFELEEDESSEEVVGMGLDDDFDDEEVIDLDDVVDLDEELIGDVKEFDLDVDLLDTDSDMDSEVDAPLGGDLLEEFNISDEDLSISGSRVEVDFGVDGKVEEQEGQVDSEVEIFINDEEVPESLATGEDHIPASEEAAEKGEITPAKLDAVVEQMEARLVDVIRETVESRLPEIVRDLLQEEIRRLKEEIK
ncbi:MAG: hypothetical protein AB2L11_07250 [Syntrophobacteraceae bacterium]